ncbi:hypothetical protein B5807_01750 [Epicoccum nigrum]|uniref:Uncharacterized protein n=1 Tax=Epicoccum nigrum TaxID=105696 RepID=A0A1Y2MCS3_EPING|nr:hypothetical protein B5807_01750 [Epicoccum nigrum]
MSLGCACITTKIPMFARSIWLSNTLSTWYYRKAQIIARLIYIHTAHAEIMRSQAHIVGRSGHSHQNKQTSSTSEDEVLSPGTSGFYNELFALYTHEEPMDTAPARNPNIAQDELRTHTIIPSVTTSSAGRGYADGAQYPIEQKAGAPAKPPAQSFLKKHFKKAKGIYQSGPPGDAEIFWTGVKTYLQNREVIEMVPPKKHYETRKPPTKPMPARGTNKAPANKQIQRQDSAVSYGNISRTSREVPIMLRQAAEVNKTLPRYPPVDAAFGQRPQQGKGNMLKINKPLPPTPLPCSLSPPRRVKASDLESPVDASWASPSMQTVDYASPVSLPQRNDQANLRPAVPLPQTSTRRPQKHSPVYGSQHPAGKYGVQPPAGKHKPSRSEKERNALKAKISYPIPIDPPVEMPTAHVLPQFKFEHNQTEDRQKAPSPPGWLDKFAHSTMPDLPALHKGRKRADSDVSFVCQGVVGQGEYRPAPLFTGDGDNLGQRMTGRWI